MGLVLKHVVRTKADTWHYRRRLPKDVGEVVGKGEFKRLLGSTEREALRNFPRINAEFERLVADARRRLAGLGANATALEVHREAERRARELAQIGITVGGETLPGSDPDAKTPHINLVPHPHRRLKTAGTARRVPLIGEALDAAKEAREAAGGNALLFPRYGRLRGADAASAILMKHIREVTKDRKIVVHSLRHRMEDMLTLAGVSEFDRNLVLGHSSGGMSERYGGAEARLEVAAKALTSALVETGTGRKRKRRNAS